MNIFFFFFFNAKRKVANCYEYQKLLNEIILFITTNNQHNTINDMQQQYLSHNRIQLFEEK